MRARILDFAAALRGAGLPIAVAEVDDALRAATVVGVERERLRGGLAATLVKEEADRPAFDGLFEVYFPLVGTRDATRRRRRRRVEAAGVGHGRAGTGGEAGGRAAPLSREIARDRAAGRPAPAEPDRRGRGRRLDRADVVALRRRTVTELDAEALRDARTVAALLGRLLEGRVRRRRRAARRGRVDLRRTARAAIATGGVPLAIRRRGRRPARPDLLALCDVSGSVAGASDLLLSLLAAMPGAFRRSDLFVYVDRLVPVSLEAGHVAPAEPFDLHARSDLGRVLAEVTTRPDVPVSRRTVVLILGDARNNRRPPRVDALRTLAERAGRVVWLVPEVEARWNTGDSALAAYAPWSDVVVECLTLEALAAAVRHHVV